MSLSLKSIFKTLREHFRILHSIGNEAKFSATAFFPLFIAIFLPLVYPLVISLTYFHSTVTDRSAVILDLDNSAITRQLTLDLNATQGLYIKNTVNSIDEGYEAVMNREADAFIFFPEDFTTQLKTFKQGDLKVYVYATNMINYASTMTAIQTTVLDKNLEIAIERIANPKGLVRDKAIHTLDPIQYDKLVLYSPALSYAEYICPVLFTLVFHQMGILMLAFSIGFHREKDKVFVKKNLWMVDYLWRILYYVPFFILGMCSVYYGYCTLFDWPHGNRIEIIKLLCFTIVANFPLAVALASVCKDRYTAFQLLLATTVIVFSYSGYVWPTYSMPDWVYQISKFMVEPQTASAMRKIAFKGATLADCQSELDHMYVLFWIYLPFGLLMAHRNLLCLPFKKLFSKKQPEDSAEPTQQQA